MIRPDQTREHDRITLADIAVGVLATGSTIAAVWMLLELIWSW